MLALLRKYIYKKNKQQQRITDSTENTLVKFQIS